MNDNIKQNVKPDKDGPGPDPVPRIPYTLEVENLELSLPDDEIIAPGWMPWMAEDNEFGEVEFAPVYVDGMPRQGFVSHGRYDAGVWQKATVEAPGMVVTISMDFGYFGISPRIVYFKNSSRVQMTHNCQIDNPYYFSVLD